MLLTDHHAYIHMTLTAIIEWMDVFLLSDDPNIHPVVSLMCINNIYTIQSLVVSKFLDTPSPYIGR